MARTLSLAARDKILDTARQLLVADGIEAFTVDAVAHASGVAKTTIYRHFANAHDLLVASLDSMFEPVPTPNTGSLRDDLTALFARLLPQAEDDRLRVVMVGLLNGALHDPELARVQDTAQCQRIDPIRTVLQLAVARGEVRADVDLDHAIDLIAGPLFMRVTVRQLPVTLADLEILVDLAVAGLRPPR